MTDWRERLSDQERRTIRRRAVPDWTEPMLATLTEARFSSPDWIYERKLDGERCLAFRRGKQIRLRSRNRKDLADNYPELVEALGQRLPEHSIVDGEIVAFEGKVTSFSRLQQRMGITDPQGSRSGFGALLLGYHDGEDLCFAGKVGTGFDQDMLESLASKLRARRRNTCPFKSTPSAEAGHPHWVTPELVAEIAFTEWTRRGRLRHPRFVGLRDDKLARDVVREKPT